MADTGEGDARQLRELRNRIDAIDAEMHRLLIERGSVIDSLIRSKATIRRWAWGVQGSFLHPLVDRPEDTSILAKWLERTKK
jgi:chorismate mutase